MTANDNQAENDRIKDLVIFWWKTLNEMSSLVVSLLSKDSHNKFIIEKQEYKIKRLEEMLKITNPKLLKHGVLENEHEKSQDGLEEKKDNQFR